MKRPTIITVEEEGHERKWGPLSKANAWRAGRFWEERGQTVKVFLENDGSRKEVEVLKTSERRRETVWLKEKNRQPPQEQPQGDDDVTLEEGNDTTTVEDDGMQQDTPKRLRQ